MDNSIFDKPFGLMQELGTIMLRNKIKIYLISNKRKTITLDKIDKMMKELSQEIDSSHHHSEEYKEELKDLREWETEK